MIGVLGPKLLAFSFVFVLYSALFFVCVFVFPLFFSFALSRESTSNDSGS